MPSDLLLGQAHQPYQWSSGRSERVIVGISPQINDLLAEARRIARTDARVLITGESGVGKELIAQFIHSQSPRGGRPFVALNCAGLPETLLESELFGHAKGSFTGAYRDKPGKFELAHSGTLFLDEVGEMSLRMQGLLLRVLETGELQKVGADSLALRVNCRVISATNRSLTDSIQQGAFRQDLFYRLDVVHVHVPPLREHAEDVPLLARHFMERFSRELDVVPILSPEACEVLQGCQWPGNVRQLENVVQRLAINCRQAVITPADLPAEIIRDAPALSTYPRVERRWSVADGLYEQVRGGASFWTVVHDQYLKRELTKADVRALVKRGLEEARGNYRGVLRLFGLPVSDYQRFMSFLRKQHCLLPYREFR
jgi:transcriptional regulator with GAF, ATPase, and Fis domain